MFFINYTCHSDGSIISETGGVGRGAECFFPYSNPPPPTKTHQKPAKLKKCESLDPSMCNVMYYTKHTDSIQIILFYMWKENFYYLSVPFEFISNVYFHILYNRQEFVNIIIYLLKTPDVVQ